MNEIELIQSIRNFLPISTFQKNKVFQSDAEVVEVNGQLLAFSIDEFCEEDGFSTQHPYSTGWNAVMGTFSDILAAGAKPLFFMNSFTKRKFATPEWVQSFSKGAGDALSKLGAFSIGGDVGSGENWKVAGVACGIFSSKPRSRITSSNSGAILVTGNFGAFNMSLLNGAIDSRIACRLGESEILNSTNSATMDSSDGLIQTLETLCKLNPELRMEVDLSSVPMAEDVIANASSFGLNQSAFCFGSAGEYELVSLTPPESLTKLTSSKLFRRIGSFSRSKNSGLHYRISQTSVLLKHVDLPDPRGFYQLDAYKRAILAYVTELFCEESK